MAQEQLKALSRMLIHVMKSEPLSTQLMNLDSIRNCLTQYRTQKQ